MRTTNVYIKGMHCRSCELLIEDELCSIPGVTQVKVNYSKGIAQVEHTKKVHYSEMVHAVRTAGYDIGKDAPKPWFTRDGKAYLDIVILSIIFMILYYIANDLGILKLADFGSNNLASLPVVFIIGLTAGISTCAALVGGLVLGASGRFAEKHPDATPLEKFKPHLFFNIGRIISFFVFGGLIGLIGSFFQMSLGMLGLLTIVVGLVMLFFGAQLTELFPRLSTLNFTIPSGIAKLIGLQEQKEKEYSHKNAMVLGGLSFFLPCGFTQVVQLYAISTGNPLAGALTMGVFAIGTAPGLLGIGGLTSLVKGAFAKPFFKFVGIVVIALSLFNISNGLNLSGLKNGISLSVKANAKEPTVNGDVQILKSIYTTSTDIQPNTFTVKAGQPVRMELDVQDDGSGCMGSFAIPGLSSKVEMLNKGNTLVYEFTPTSTGTYNITCAMGVPRGSITVI